MSIVGIYNAPLNITDDPVSLNSAIGKEERGTLLCFFYCHHFWHFTLESKKKITELSNTLTTRKFTWFLLPKIRHQIDFLAYVCGQCRHQPSFLCPTDRAHWMTGEFNSMQTLSQSEHFQTSNRKTPLPLNWVVRISCSIYAEYISNGWRSIMNSEVVQLEREFGCIDRYSWKSSDRLSFTWLPLLFACTYGFISQCIFGIDRFNL